MAASDRKARRAGLSVLRLLIFLIPLSFIVWLGQQIFMDISFPAPVDVIIPGGVSTVQIGRILYRNRVIRSEIPFRLAASLSGLSGALQKGHYRFAQAQDMWTVIQRLHRGDVVLYRLTVPEGLRTDEVIALLAKKTETRPQDWEKALFKLLNGDAAEGRLMPETYVYEKPVHPMKLLGEMIRSQKKILNRLGKDSANRKQLLIIASIIEKETAIKAERPVVASVIYNRLKKNMPLQMDPTVIYGLWHLDGAFSGNLRKQDLERDMPWNTYTRKRLPPTPICNPGAASLEAAARPADTDFLYFVADGSGGHLFSATLADHAKNVKRWVDIERKMKAEKE